MCKQLDSHKEEESHIWILYDQTISSPKNYTVQAMRKKVTLPEQTFSTPAVLSLKVDTHTVGMYCTYTR